MWTIDQKYWLCIAMVATCSSCSKLETWKQQWRKKPTATVAETPTKPAMNHPFLASLLPHLILMDGSKPTEESFASSKMTLLYFSDSWHGPSRSFTGKLTDHYQDLQAAGIQVVLINHDKDEKKMLEYMKSYRQPWPALPPEIGSLQGIDLKSYSSPNLPSLALVDANGKLLQKGLAWIILPEILKNLPPPHPSSQTN